MEAQEHRTLRVINLLVGEMADRDLDILKKIDKKIDRLRDDEEVMRIYADTIARHIPLIGSLPVAVDKDGMLVAMFERTRDVLAEMHAILSKKCDSARTAPELKPEDGVVEAYCEVMVTTAHLHDMVNELCWAIGEHDADFDEVVPGGPYGSVDDLMAALRA